MSKTGMKRFVECLVLGAAALCAPACGTSAQDLCDLECECEGCSPGGYDECLREAEGDEREADFRECGDLYAELLACEDATGFCSGADWDTSCKPEKERFKSCTDG